MNNKTLKSHYIIDYHGFKVVFVVDPPVVLRWFISTLSNQEPLKINSARFHPSGLERFWWMDFYLIRVIVFHNFNTIRYEEEKSESSIWKNLGV